VVVSLIGLISHSSNHENAAENLSHLAELVILIMKPPAPFFNSKVQVSSFIFD